MIGNLRCKLDVLHPRKSIRTPPPQCVAYAPTPQTLMTRTRSMIECLTCVRSFIVSFISLRVFFVLAAKQNGNFNYGFFSISLSSRIQNIWCALAYGLCHAIVIVCMGIFRSIVRALITRDYCFCCWPFNLIITIRINVIKYYFALCLLCSS